MAHHAMKRLGPTGLVAIFVAITMSLLAMATGTAAATTQKKASPAVTTATAPKADRYSTEVTGTTSDGRTVTGKFTPTQVPRGEEGAGRQGHARRQDHRRQQGSALVPPARSACPSRTSSPDPPQPADGRPHRPSRLRRAEPGARAAGPEPARARDPPGPGRPRHHRSSEPGALLGNLLCAVAGLLDAAVCSATCCARSRIC